MSHRVHKYFEIHTVPILLWELMLYLRMFRNKKVKLQCNKLFHKWAIMWHY